MTAQPLNTTPGVVAGNDRAVDVLDAFGIAIVGADGYEADDVIGTLATQAMTDDFDVLICSGDRDSFQLVNDRTTVIYPMRGVSEMKRMTPAAADSGEDSALIARLAQSRPCRRRAGWHAAARRRRGPRPAPGGPPRWPRRP